MRRSVLTMVAAGMAASLIAGAFAGAALAEPLTGKEAKKALFMAKASEARIVSNAGLDAQSAQMLAAVGAQQPWYGAIAISPSEGLMSEATVAAAKYHDVPSAARAALRDCNARKKDQSDCILAAIIVPKGYEEGRPLQLSAEATEAFRKDYKGGALATSAATGAFGIGADTASAVAACQAKAAEAVDCLVVIAD